MIRIYGFYVRHIFPVGIRFSGQDAVVAAVGAFQWTASWTKESVPGGQGKILVSTSRHFLLFHL